MRSPSIQLSSFDRYRRDLRGSRPLDAESEKAVTEALDEIMHTRTTLFIAHRLTTAARADKIAMLRKGEVLEIGSHKELLEANGPYAAMYRMFSSGLLDEGTYE